jgi:hypothetical protein
MGAATGQIVDHINGDGLDCRRKNLRLCTTAENIRNQRRHKNNTSGAAGVFRSKCKKKWCARVMVNRRGINLGTYGTLQEAVAARRAGEIKYFGEFAPHLCRGPA